MNKNVPECYAPYVKTILESNWDEFVGLLSDNYEDDEEAERIAEEIVKALA
ncbi:hypothetical protein [Rosenbergiella australiborealis]|uniref:hypothetical protein n=1 Tax=Rosenbergiella australiborealis TaxID=1544696 RepID=UPI001F4EE056|nr:hypothetical protein [Rosenbergiella australiborealis]